MMKFRVILFGIICLCTLQLAVAGVLENFGTPSTWHVNQGEVNGGGFAYAEPPDGSSLAGKCTWDTTHAGFIEYYLNSPRAIPELKDGLSGVITLKVY
ncbi:MAG TPA: hypothetical protein VHV83_10185, partial [Armatimonadota bacterium]|nr:hypothetical protein [Armatimonadota bacterium]